MKRSLLALACMPFLAPSLAGAGEVSDVDAMRVLFESFTPRGQAGLSRLVQDDVQQFCSRRDWARDKARMRSLQNEQRSLIKYPSDGVLMGDWRRGERIAQTGVGLQYSDDPKIASGGNCYACHQLSPEEISYGTIGPSLRNYGRRHGTGAQAQRAAYGKIYNAQAYAVCSNMPRFGHSGILTEQQIKDLVALLLDPQSPVNR